jgi:protein-S-isoprenylcysteine O-methyltransferase Ste14
VTWRELIDVPWIVFVVYWAVAAMRTRRTQKRESAGSRYSVMVLLFTGYGLIFLSEKIRTGVLHAQIVAPNAPFAMTGVVLTWLGIGLALWARWHLAENWSGRITIKEGHELIRTGPYAHLRHPIYSGLDLATIGTVLVINRWGCLMGAVLVIVAYWIKARKEEAMLSTRFGEAFQEHCRRTGFLFPKFG